MLVLVKEIDKKQEIGKKNTNVKHERDMVMNNLRLPIVRKNLIQAISFNS